MITAAVISIDLGDGLSPLTECGGLSLLQRALLTVQRAGARTCYVLSEDEDVAGLKCLLAHDARLTVDIVWVTQHRPLRETVSTSTGHCIVFPCNVLFRPALIQDGELDVSKGQGVDAGWLIRGGGNNATLSIIPASQLLSLMTVWDTRRAPTRG